MAPLVATETLDAVSREWDHLAEQVDASPFMRPGWIAAWWRSFGSGSLRVLTERSGSELRAVLPIVARHGALRAPCNWHTPEFGLVRHRAGGGEALLAELFGRRAPVVGIRFLADGGTTAEQLVNTATEAGYRAGTRLSARYPVVSLDGDWDTYLAGLSRSLRGDVERQRRRISGLGELSLQVGDDTGLLSAAFALEASGWKGREGTAIASHPHTRRFYTEIAEWARDRGWLRLTFLYVGERPLAFHLALEHGGAYLPLKGGFDHELHRYSPGKLIVHATVRRAFETGLGRYEFLAGNEDYKLAWANSVRERLDFEAFAPTILGRSVQTVYHRGRPLARRALALRGRAARSGSATTRV
jgi:CelD/BcsL family acetyltransferase involved in cellulose biosynthesis